MRVYNPTGIITDETARRICRAMAGYGPVFTELLDTGKISDIAEPVLTAARDRVVIKDYDSSELHENLDVLLAYVRFHGVRPHAYNTWIVA